MNQIWIAVQKTYFATLTYLSRFSFILIFFIAIWMGVDVMGRSFFGKPIPGAPELVKSLLPAIVFLSLAYTLRMKRHVRVEILLHRLPRQAREVFDLLANLSGFAIFCVVTYASWAPAWSGWLSREYEGVQLKIPVYPVRFIILIGAGLFALQFLIDAVANMRALLSVPKKGRH